MTQENRSYTKLEAWMESRTLVSLVYDLVEKFPEEEKWGLISQIRRSVVSVPSNIAEGTGRQHSKETVQFLYIARGSLYEIETQLFLAFDQKYVGKKDLDNVLEKITSCKRLIQGYINYLKKKN